MNANRMQNPIAKAERSVGLARWAVSAARGVAEMSRPALLVPTTAPFSTAKRRGGQLRAISTTVDM